MQVNLDLVTLRGQSDTKLPFCGIDILPTTHLSSSRALDGVTMLFLELSFQFFGLLITLISYESFSYYYLFLKEASLVKAANRTNLLE